MINDEGSKEIADELGEHPDHSLTSQRFRESRRLFLKRATGLGLGLAFVVGPLLGSSWLERANAATPEPVASAMNGTPIIAALPGPPRPWQQGQSIYSGVTNLASGNVHLEHPICGWSGKGGGLSFSLYFNSQSVRTGGALGTKWNHSFLTRLVNNGADIILIEADGTEVTYTGSGSAYSPPPGVYDHLASVAGGLWTLTRKGGAQILRFRNNGSLDSIADNNGNMLQCMYDSGSGLLLSVTDATGRALLLNYSGIRLTSVTDAEGRTWGILYTATGVPAQINAPPIAGASPHTDFSYDSFGNVSSITDRLGRTWSFTYGSSNDLTSTADPDGQSWGYVSARAALLDAQQDTQASASSSTAVAWPMDVEAVGGASDPTGATVQYGFDADGRIVAMKGATDDRAVFTYDVNNNRLSSETDSGATRS